MLHVLLLCATHSSSALCTPPLLHRLPLCSKHSDSSMCSMHFVNAAHTPFLCTLSASCGPPWPPAWAPCPPVPLHALHTIFTCHVGGSGGHLSFGVSVSHTPHLPWHLLFAHFGWSLRKETPANKAFGVRNSLLKTTTPPKNCPSPHPTLRILTAEGQGNSMYHLGKLIAVT